MSESTNRMQSMVRLAYKKEILRGDLNLIQDEALQWALADEIDQNVLLERERMRYTILAANPQLYQQLYEEDENEVPDNEIEWIVPESLDEIESIINILEATHHVEESSPTG